MSRRTAGAWMAGVLLAVGAAPAAAAEAAQGGVPRFERAVAHDRSAPLRELPPSAGAHRPEGGEVRPERGPVAGGHGNGHAADPAVQHAAAPGRPVEPPSSFEGLSNQDNFDVFGFRVNPPDPVGDIGPDHYVEMVNLALAVYGRDGTRLLGPIDTGTLWTGFAVDDCTDPAGDPIVVYDQQADRWVLSQFTTRGFSSPSQEFFTCVAVSTSGDPTGSYHRYAFSTGTNFPDYPKYGIWGDSYVITTREFGEADPSVYGIGVYGLERRGLLAGDPDARSVSFLLEEGEVPLSLIGDGLLPADVDGHARPGSGSPAPIVGTQDDGAGYGALRDALNVWELDVRWRSTPTASLTLAQQLPVAPFDSIFPCGPTSRDCLPQPGIANPTQFLDILSYRQRPTWRLAYRRIGGAEVLVTNQSVEARPGVAGVRWYELRRTPSGYDVHQQGTYAPADGVHRWMGSVAMDRRGAMALGFSVVNGVDVFPGIRYTGRLPGDPAGVMTQPEGTIAEGSGVQTTTNSRWGDYSSMNVDPLDDCTFWYVNEYYTAAGQLSSPAGWQTRIGRFRLPGC